MAPTALPRLLLLAGLPGLAGAVLLQASARSEASSHAAMLPLKHTFREKILTRFEHTDKDGDGSVSLAELKAGYGHAPAHEGVKVLSSMLAACAGGAEGGTKSCSRQQMEASLESWVSSQHTSRALSLLQKDSRGGFRELKGDGAGEPCGASAEQPAAAGGVRCFWQGASCFKGNPVLAWGLHDVCDTRGCICEPTPETKRLAKLGLTGALAVTTAKNFSDPEDVMSVPACGGGWTGSKLVGRLENLNGRLGPADQALIRLVAPTVNENEDWQHLVTKVDSDTTEVALFKTAEHQLTRGGPPEKVCMISWQATRSMGDWKTNLMGINVKFKYSPSGVNFKLPKGMAWTYESTRETVKQAFEEECCTPDFTARKLVISGHSHGGALAEVHAMDAISNWRCSGRDLGADDIVLVTAAPHKDLVPMGVLSSVFSCGNKANCLAGSVVTLVTEGDFVGGGFDEHAVSAPRHPSVVTALDCPPMPAASQGSKKWWCHGIFNYMPTVEEALVGRAGWGSSCAGECGDVNRQVQCNQVVIIGERGCVYAPPQYLKAPTACDSKKSWKADKEMCDCHFDNCMDLTTLDCRA